MNDNIKLGSCQIYFNGLDESEAFDISDAECVDKTKWADPSKPLRVLDPLEINREWTLVYCKDCGRPFPIIQFDAMIYGTTGWSCPLCAVIRRVRRNYDSVR